MYLVSIIIPKTKNENIDKLLFSINISDYRDVEVIVIDEGLERSAQRNIGISRAKGKYLLFADSDWELSSTLISECVRLMKVYDAIYIPEEIFTSGLFARIRNWERQFYTATPIDVVRFVCREGCPKFDEELIGPEDCDWDRRIKGARTTCKSCYYHHDNVSMIKWFSKKAYYSKSMDLFAQKNPNDKVLDLKWRCWIVFMEENKYKRFLGNPLMAICVIGTLLIRGIILKVNQR